MDIRTKLVFALVAVALVSMMALGAFMYGSTNQQLERGRLEQLDGMAESIKEGLEEVAAGWRDRVQLISSRTDLIEILLANDLAGNPRARARVERILSDAERAEPSVESLAVYDADGRYVGSAGWATETDLEERLTSLLSPEDDVVYLGIQSSREGEFRIAYSAALTSDGTTGGELVGVLHVRLNLRPLVFLSRERERLGATGEVIIAIRDAEGTVRVPRRLEPEAPPIWEPVELRGNSDPVTLAMRGENGFSSGGLTDDRGEPVWASFRSLPETGWGLVVKIDASDGMGPIKQYSSRLADVIISLGAFAILVGTILGLRFAKPIHELAKTAERIKEGDLSLRAPVTSRDEVGLLARNFNQMADELEKQVTLLKEFQLYFDLSLDMLCIAGSDAYFRRVNPAFERVLGWTTEELLTRQFLDFVHPDDLEITQEEINSLARGLPTISFKNRYMCKDGSHKILAWTAHPERETGLIYAIARDVTALEQERGDAVDTIKELRDRLEESDAKLREEP